MWPCYLPSHTRFCQSRRPRPLPPVLLCVPLWPVVAGILTLAISFYFLTHGPEASKTQMATTNACCRHSSFPALAVPLLLSSSVPQLTSEAPKLTLLTTLSQAPSLESPYYFHASFFLPYKQSLLSQPRGPHLWPALGHLPTQTAAYSQTQSSHLSLDIQTATKTHFTDGKT